MLLISPNLVYWGGEGRGSGGRGGRNIYALSIPTTQTYWILTGFTIHFGSMRFVKFSSRGDYTGCVYGGTEKGEFGGVGVEGWGVGLVFADETAWSKVARSFP